MWFTQAEAQFNLKGITADDTKYYYVLAALDQDTATRLLDLVSQLPDENKYQWLKDGLVDTFGLNLRDRASCLLHFLPLKDSKASALFLLVIVFSVFLPTLIIIHCVINGRKFVTHTWFGVASQELYLLA